MLCASGLRGGLYYTGGMDWLVNPERIDTPQKIYSTILDAPEHAAYADAHWRELIERYQPAVLWGDIMYVRGADVVALFADFYNRVPDGVVNDRFATLFSSPKLPGMQPPSIHYDFLTPEYTALARRLGHPSSLAQALVFETAIHWARRDPGAQRERAQETIALAEAQGLPYFLGLGRTFHASARVATGEACAVGQETKQTELLVVSSLARLWQRRGKPAEARRWLAPVLAWFTEGFETGDHVVARRVLKELG